MTTRMLPECATVVNIQAGGEKSICAVRRPALVERELDVHDIQLLKAAATAGEVVPKTIHQQRRLDRLDQEGYVESARRDHSDGDATSSWVYRLTKKGHKAAERPHS